MTLKFRPAKERPLVFTTSVPYHITSSFYLNCSKQVSESNTQHPDEQRQCMSKYWTKIVKCDNVEGGCVAEVTHHE